MASQMANVEIDPSFEPHSERVAAVINPAADEFVVSTAIQSSDNAQVVHIRSPDELRAAAADWDDLWLRSDVTFPTIRAELLAQWLERFAGLAEFHAVAIKRDGRFVAALPIVRRRLGGAIRAGVLPCNEWSSSGECLLDFAADANAALSSLLKALMNLNLDLLWLDEAIPQSDRWQAFTHIAAACGLTTLLVPRWRVGRVPIQGDWESCRAGWSRKHRQHMAWSQRQLAREGELRLDLLSQLDADQAENSMRLALEIENLGWKGRTGGSVASVSGMSDFFISQARQLAAWRQLELAFLYCGERPIAFCYGQSAKGVFHSAKIGYDPRWSRFSPGQVLRYLLLERFYAEGGKTAVDFLGPMTESHAHWRPDTYTVARFAAALRPVGRLALWAYKTLRRPPIVNHSSLIPDP
jgi:CelD/BcsL family acetyltransferase involved in cellulose biosynthesis